MYSGTVPATVETGGRVADQAPLQARIDPAIDFATFSRPLRVTRPLQPHAYHAILALTIKYILGTWSVSTPAVLFAGNAHENTEFRA